MYSIIYIIINTALMYSIKYVVININCIKFAALNIALYIVLNMLY